MIKRLLIAGVFCQSLAYAVTGNNNDLFEIGAMSDKEKILKFGLKPDSPALVVDEKDRILKYKIDPLSPLNVGFTNSEKEYNVITTNPNFELGKVGWVASDSSTFAIKKDNPLFGSASAMFQATKENQYIETIPYDVPLALKGKPCGLTFYYKSADENYKVMLVSEQGEIIAGTEQILRTFLVPNKTMVAFTCPSDKKIKVRITSSNKAAPIVLDRFFLGEKEPEKPAPVPEKPEEKEEYGFYGSITIYGSSPCVWKVFPIGYKIPDENPKCDSLFVLERLGKVESAGKLPMIRFPKMPEGTYLFVLAGSFTSLGPKCQVKFQTDDDELESGIKNNYVVTEYENFEVKDRRFYVTIKNNNITNPLIPCELPSIVDEQRFRISVYRFPL